jgi:hypothetical protein
MTWKGVGSERDKGKGTREMRRGRQVEGVGRCREIIGRQDRGKGQAYGSASGKQVAEGAGSGKGEW